MNIQPTRPGQTCGTQAERLKDSAPLDEGRSRRSDGAAGPPEAADRVELSHDARELQRSDASPKILSLADARLKQVLRRLSEGFYDRAEVRENVLHRVIADLEDGSPGR